MFKKIWIFIKKFFRKLVDFVDAYPKTTLIVFACILVFVLFACKSLPLSNLSAMGDREIYKDNRHYYYQHVYITSSSDSGNVGDCKEVK